MNNKTVELINSYYSQLDDNSPLKRIFCEVMVYYLEFHNTQTDIVELGYDSLFCSIHNYFESEDSHNCIGCNMNETNRRIENYLLGYRLFNDTYTTFTNFIFILYLQVEHIFEYLKIVKFPDSTRSEHFRVFIEIKRWANFLKHPKTFSLVHHPIWTYEGEDQFQSNGNKPIIDTEFVSRYFAGEKHNDELSAQLSNKQDLEVTFPNPLNLITQFCEAQENFVQLIRDDKSIRDILNDKATIRDYYNTLYDSSSDDEN